MAQNRRIFYAVHAVGLAPCGTNNFTAVHGLQSVGINTKFNLEQVFEIGQLQIYQNLENLPDIEATLEKVLDGSPLLGHLATYGAPDASLLGRSAQRVTLGLSIFSDLQKSASGTPLQQCTCSGMYLSAWTFDLKVEGSSTESVTLVGNNKVWKNSAPFTFSGGYTNNDSPAAPEGVNRRQHVVMTACRFPQKIPGIDGSGINQPEVTGGHKVHFQSIRITVNLGREALLELGTKSPYFRYANFPVEVRSDFEVLDVLGDSIDALEDADNVGAGEHIYIEMTEGTKIDLGTKNVISTSNYGGANAGARGGNAQSTFSFVTYSDMTVQHPADPSPGLAA